MIAEGLLPRFLTIEYHGKRPPSRSRTVGAQPSLALIEMVQQLVVHVQTIMAKSEVQLRSTFDPYAQQLFDDFDRYLRRSNQRDQLAKSFGICGTVPTLRR
jgi:hypothetical protein